MLKSIETIYKGYRMRSRLEGRWAVFLDTLGISWEYEGEGYDLGNVWYLPDFWLPHLDLWFEAKGDSPTEQELEKAARLAEASGKRVAILWGNIPFPERDFAPPSGKADVLEGYVVSAFPHGYYSATV